MRAALQFHVGEIAKQELETNGAQGILPLSGAAVATLTEMSLSWIEIIAKDLRDFSRHAKRKVVTTDDVKLLARKVPRIHQAIEAFEARHLQKDGGKKPNASGTSNRKVSSGRPKRSLDEDIEIEDEDEDEDEDKDEDEDELKEFHSKGLSDYEDDEVVADDVENGSRRLKKSKSQAHKKAHVHGDISSDDDDFFSRT